MTLFINLIIFLLEFTYIYIFMSNLSGKRIHDTLRKMFIVSVPGIFLMTSLLLPMKNSTLAALCILLFYLLMLTLIFQIRLTNLILLFALEYSILGTFQLVIYTLLHLCSFFIHGDIIPIFGNLVLLLLCGLLYRFSSLSFLYERILSWNNFVKLILINVFFVIFSLFILIRTDFMIQDNLLILFLLVILLISINIDSVFMHHQYDIQKKELEAYKTYLPIIDELIDYIRMNQHDFNNHLQAIEMLPLTHPNYDSLSEALASYQDHLTPDPRHIHLLKMNYHLVAGFLISKCTQSSNQHKNLDIVIRTYSLTTQVSEYVLIDMLGILIDNALDACPEQGTIDLLFDTDKEKLYVTIKNDIEKIPDGFPDSLFKKNFTTKTSSSLQHGIGLYKLKKLIDSFHGSIHIATVKENDKKKIQIRLII